MNSASDRISRRADFAPPRAFGGIFYLLVFLASFAYPLPSTGAQTPGPPVEAETALVAPVVRKLELSGTVTSPRVSSISTSFQGLVSAVHFDSGARVKTGDLLLELDSELEEAAHKQTEALAAQAAGELADAKRRLGIAKKLAERKYGTQNEVEARQAEVEIDRAAYESAKAAHARRAAILERHRLRAPYSGVISKKMAEVGQWVVPGTPAFELVEMEGLRIDVPVPQQYYARLREGAEVSVKFDAIPGETIPARIGALIPVSDPDARTFTLRVLPEGEDIPITPGMSARIAVNLSTGRQDVVVNRDAIIRHPDGRTTVWVLEQKGDKTLVEERKIEIGLAFDGVFQVRSGLKEGERVVVRGNESLREGQAVRLAN